jgi:glyoxylase-like metal-dependent hydrolase (beta-lactamase superfamily II)
MELISPGIVHWTAPHERIGIDVSSYYLSDELVLLDPMEPPEGLDWFEENGPPTDVLLTNRHHDRHAWRFAERFGCRVHCVRVGLGELEGRGEVVPFDFGDELPGGAIAHEVGAICPDECALHIPKHRALAVADGVIRYGDQLGFVPDKYMDDAEETKRALRQAYARLAEDLDFDALLVAHGEPLVGGARAVLREFAEEA